MKIPPKYIPSQNILKFVSQIERYKSQLDLLPQNKRLEKIHRQRSILKSSVYSARIEGNLKTLSEVTQDSIKNTREKQNLELANLYKSLEYVLYNSWEDTLKLKDIKKLHQIVLQDLLGSAGQLRREPSAIYNTAGIAIYVCPPPQEIKNLLMQLIKYINAKNEPIAPIKAALAHYAFEKIHPFLDGNGRVGRILIHLMLKKWDFDLKGLVAFEEFLDQHRQEYYDLLNINKQEITPFVEFTLEGFRNSLRQTIKVRNNNQQSNREDLLPPRRHEVLQIIRDHRQVSFDFIGRRFMRVPQRTLQYDLKKLRDEGYIKKRGVTKGAVYEPL